MRRIFQLIKYLPLMQKNAIQSGNDITVTTIPSCVALSSRLPASLSLYQGRVEPLLTRYLNFARCWAGKIKSLPFQRPT